jgi:dimethylamine monooxygenase subunit C
MVSWQATTFTDGVGRSNQEEHPMRPELGLTSVPAWAVAVSTPDADLTGRSFTAFALDPAGAEVVTRWTDQITAGHPDAPVRVHTIADPDAAAAVLSGEIAELTIGWRLLIAGPANRCLKLRAHAVRLGVADDEMTVGSTTVSERDVHCVHCRHVTTAEVELETVLPCAGCGRNLLVYYHVSRLQGAHLGFQIDAEELPEAIAS